MRNINWKIASAVAMLTFVGAENATAADLGGSIKDDYNAPRCANFRGFYAGGHLGWAYYRADRTDLDGYLLDRATYSATEDGFAGGAQAGYNFQHGCTVFGLEADWSWTGARADTQLFPNDPSDFRIRSRLDSYGTLRTRTGVVVDNLLIFLTGGIAWADMRTSWQYNFLGVNETLSYRDNRLGWTAGFGAEYKFSDRISLNSQVLYLSFPDQDHTRLSASSGNFSFKDADSIWESRIGVNFKFGN